MNPLSDGKPVAGFPAYRVTPDGNIWSLYVRGSRRLAPEWRLMKFNIKDSYKAKYRRVVLLDSEGNRQSHHVHKLILEAFIGPCPEGQEACHNNGDRFDNRLDNLRWDTHSNNQLDRLKHGTGCQGEAQYLAKLTNEKVLTIRSEYATGVSQRALAAKYGVVKGTIGHIVKRNSWKHI